MSFTTITATDLSTVAGGAGTFKDHADAESARIMPMYKEVVCAGAGVKGGPQLADGLWKNSTDGEKIAAANALKGLCLSNSRLPSEAPAKPF